MSNGEKRLSNPFSTGGGGHRFETHVQTSFVVLMLTGGYTPCLPCGSINKIKLQGRFAEYQTDDMIVFVQDEGGKKECKLLAQIKHSIKITKNNSVFAEVIQAAWRDFNNPEIFTKGTDIIALITGPLSATDTNDVRVILDWARHSENSVEFFQKVELAHFSSDLKRRKLQAFKANLRKANGDTEVPDEEVFEFLNHFHLLGYDLDIKAGVTLALLHSLIGQYSSDNVPSIWARLVGEVQSANQNAGTIDADSIPEDLLSAFKERRYETIPDGFARPPAPKSPNVPVDKANVAALTVATLLGKWDESNENDLEIIRRLSDGF